MITGIVYSRPDGSYVISHNGYPYHVIEGDPLMAEVREAIVNNPAIPEPAPPEPTPEELAAAARSRALADLAALDARAIRPLRAIAAGTATDGDRKELERIETEVVELRKRLA